MAKRLVVHIGAMKSGTSFLQNVMIDNAAALADRGVKLAGDRWTQQVHAVHELIEHGGRRQPPMPTDGRFATVVRDVHAWPGTSVISMEFLAPRGAHKIQQLLAEFDGTEIEVVMTARDLTRTLPAMWQESVQNGGKETWPDYLHAVRHEKPREAGPGTKFWAHQGLADIADRWSRVVGKDRFTLVTVPPKGAAPSLLWDRFAGLLDLGEAQVDLAVRGNPSIGPASAMVLRAVNERLEERPLSKKGYNQLVKHMLGKEVLAARGRSEAALGMAEPWVLERGEQEVEALRRLRLRVVGDLEELRPIPVPGLAPDEIGTAEQVDAAVDGLVEVLRRLQRAQLGPGKGGGKGGKGGRSGKGGRKGGGKGVGRAGGPA